MTGNFPQACSASDLQNTESDLNACFLILPSMVHKECYAGCIEQKLICGSLSYEAQFSQWTLVEQGQHAL